MNLKKPLLSGFFYLRLIITEYLYGSMLISVGNIKCSISIGINMIKLHSRLRVRP